MGDIIINPSGSWFNIKMLSYQYRKSHCGDKTVVRSSYLHNAISYTSKTTSLYWIAPGAEISKINMSLSTMRKDFNYISDGSQCWEMIENAHVFLFTLPKNLKQQESSDESIKMANPQNEILIRYCGLDGPVLQHSQILLHPKLTPAVGGHHCWPWWRCSPQETSQPLPSPKRVNSSNPGRF